MKIWNGYGSEHSANLVMIGHFESAEGAATAVEKLNALRDQADEDEADKSSPSLFGAERYSEQMLRLLSKIKVHSLEPSELQQFLLDISWKSEGDRVVITTEELEVSALLKVLLDEGARVEVFSAHVHKGSGYGRGE
ncbi:MAG: DUF6375 family protein [Chromatiaceae bacterium]